MNYSFGILGPGRIAAKFAATFTSGLVQNAAITGVASHHEVRASQFAKQHGIPNAFGSYEALLERKDIDVVYISNLNPQHYASCMAAIKHHKHVLCEKPLSITQKEAVALAAAAKAEGVFIMEALWSRFTPAFSTASRWMAEGRIGRLRGLSASLCFARSPAEFPRLFNASQGGGALLDLGVYGLGMVQHFAKPLPLQQFTHHSVAVEDVDESSYLQLLYPEGVAGEVRCSIGYQGMNDAFIYGEKGFIRLAPPFHFGQRAELYIAPFPPTPQLPLLRPAEVFEEGSPSGFEYEINHLVDCLNEGKTESSLAPMADSIEIAGIFDSAAAAFSARVEQ